VVFPGNRRCFWLPDRIYFRRPAGLKDIAQQKGADLNSIGELAGQPFFAEVWLCDFQMDLVVVILIGLGIGTMVELLLPGHTAGELFLAMTLGVAGALLARYVGELADWYANSEPRSFLASCLGAIGVLLIYGGFFRRGRNSRNGR